MPSVTLADIRTYVINLKRRPDRRDHMTQVLTPQLEPIFTSDWNGPFDGHDLDLAGLREGGYRLFPWRVDSANPWWSRPLKLGEIGCTLSHLACWCDAATSSHRYILVLEDDVVLAPQFLDDLLEGLRRLTDRVAFDLLYLGRYPLEPDKPMIPGFVVPGYSHCTFGYLLTRRAVDVLIGARLDQAIVPIDEFLPACYIDHPRPDLRARFPRQLAALAFQPPLVRQLPKHGAGSDTEDSAFVDE